jgi:hypothetical protein
MGQLELPPDRWGERPVADDAAGTALESVQLKRKGYWMSTVLVRHRDDLSPRADGKELKDIQWFVFEEAKEAVRNTNQPEKIPLLLRALDACLRDIQGGLSPQERLGRTGGGA